MTPFANFSCPKNHEDVVQKVMEFFGLLVSSSWSCKEWENLLFISWLLNLVKYLLEFTGAPENFFLSQKLESQMFLECLSHVNRSRKVVFILLWIRWEEKLFCNDQSLQCFLKFISKGVWHLLRNFEVNLFEIVILNSVAKLLMQFGFVDLFWNCVNLHLQDCSFVS